MKYLILILFCIFLNPLTLFAESEESSPQASENFIIDTKNEEIDLFLKKFIEKGGSQEALENLHQVFSDFVNNNAKKELHEDDKGSFMEVTMKVIPVILKMSNDDKLILWRMYRDKKKDVEDKNDTKI